MHWARRRNLHCFKQSQPYKSVKRHFRKQRNENPFYISQEDSKMTAPVLVVVSDIEADEDIDAGLLFHFEIFDSKVKNISDVMAIKVPLICRKVRRYFFFIWKKCKHLWA